MLNRIFSVSLVLLFAVCGHAERKLFEGVEKKGGNYLMMSHAEAAAYCIEKKQRLATIRELAEWAQEEKRAVGIWPKTTIPDDKIEYQRIEAKNDDGSEDDFYFSRENYENKDFTPTTENPQGLVWSSSGSKLKGDDGLVYVLHSETGNISKTLSTNKTYFFRCVAKK
jgi:hypothetical protein